MKLQENRFLVIILVLSFAEKSLQDLEFVPFNKVLPWLMKRNFSSYFPMDQLLTNSSSYESAYFGFPTNTSFAIHHNGSTNSLCALHLSSILTKIRADQRDLKLIMLLDSFAKPLAGIQSGNLDWPGQEKQCESIKFPPDSDDAPGFNGKFCKAKWSTEISSNISLKHHTEVCVPSSCSGEDIEYLRVFLEKFSFLKISKLSHVTVINCKDPSRSMIASIVFFSICFGFIVIGIFATIRDNSTPGITETLERKTLLSAFSIKKNWKSLSGKRVHKHDVLIIHYLRGFLAISVVIEHYGAALGYSFVSDSGSFIESLKYLRIYSILNIIIMAPFFFLSGFLIHSDYMSPDQHFNPFKLILKTYLRLSPSYYFALFAQAAYLSTVGQGPKLNLGFIEIERNFCTGFLLENLSFTQNHLTSEKMVGKSFQILRAILIS